ncbi:MAG: glycoside hydrolase family 92 protein [Candidatus Latescibacteria bacterium]|nr:glycoside hydrolase family 92 protein [Candidatus Latescibacterota bacterium]
MIENYCAYYDIIEIKYLYNGKEFIIETTNNSSENMYIQSMEINGKITDKTWLSDDEIKSGSTIRFKMSFTPNIVWGSGIEDALPVIR